VIRQDVELSSPQVGVAAFGSIVKISGRAYSEHPTHQCLERLSLVGKGGWISVRLNRPPPDDDCIVEFVGVDHTFDPESPGRYHLQEQRKVISSRQPQIRQQQRESTPSRGGGRRNNVSNDNTTADDLSSVDENDHNVDDIVDDYNEYDLDNTAVAAAVAATRATDYLSSSSSSSSQSSPPTTTTTNTNDNTNNDYSRLQQPSQTHTQSQPQHSQQTHPNHNNNNNHNSNPNQYSQYCVVCLTSERNATIVHGTTGHVVCCLVCARILQARGDKCPVCRMEIDMVIQHFYA